ncbi:protein O-GlcNAcase [Akkermansia muciniphila]|nr:protein O-GlcNAcase [Akkermansia muciniphila]
MCPTEYNRGWADPKPGTYLDILGDRLDPSIHVMWTGNSVCHDITLEGQQWVNRRIKRPSYVWWNFPVTDYCRSNLCMGRVYGLASEPGAKESMGGFVSNPMDKPEASKVSLFGLADYSWNINGFKSDEAWKEGVRRLFPKAAEAMQVFVNHNSDQGPNGHGYRREESVEIEPVVKRVLEAAREGKIEKKDTALLKRNLPVWPPLRPSSVPRRTIRG